MVKTEGQTTEVQLEGGVKVKVDRKDLGKRLKYSINFAKEENQRIGQIFNDSGLVHSIESLTIMMAAQALHNSKKAKLVSSCKDSNI
jgi:hypothetical protein